MVAERIVQVIKAKQVPFPELVALFLQNESLIL
jgi:hypothetical protein